MTENTATETVAVETKVATASDVRKAAREGRFTLPEGVSTASLFGKGGTAENPGTVRGRIHPAQMDAFLASKAGKGFERPFLGNTDEDGQPVAKVTRAPSLVTVPRVNAKGRPLAPTQMTRAEALALAGKPATQRGALSKATLAAAGAAHVASGAKVVKPQG